MPLRSISLLALLAFLPRPAEAAEVWFEGEWEAVIQDAFCTVIRFEVKDGAQTVEVGAAKPMLPCPIKEWHKTTFTTADDTVTIEASKLTDRMTLELDQDGEAIIMADGKTRLKRIEPPDLGGVNPTDPTRYELPGRISVSIDGWTPVPGLGLFFKHSDGGTVVFIPTQQDQIGAKMIELGKLYGRLYQFSKMDTDQQIGEFQGRVFESEVKRMSDGVAQARLIAIEACCGEAVIVYAAATSANDPRSMWQNVDRMMASMRESTLSVDAGCAAPTARMKQEMKTLTDGTWGELLRQQLVLAASALQIELVGRAGADGPSASDQEWATCAGNALSAVEDVAKGVWQMNQGDYGQEWVDIGRFGVEQESMLDRIHDPGALCEDWVKGQFPADTVAPIFSYLSARDQMDELNCPTKPPATPPTGG